MFQLSDEDFKAAVIKILNNQLQILWKLRIQNFTKNIKVILKETKVNYRKENIVSEINNSVSRRNSGLNKTEESVNLKTNQCYSPNKKQTNNPF